MPTVSSRNICARSPYRYSAPDPITTCDAFTDIPFARFRYATIASRSSPVPMFGDLISSFSPYRVTTPRKVRAKAENENAVGTRWLSAFIRTATGSACRARTDVPAPWYDAKNPLRSRASA